MEKNIYLLKDLPRTFTVNENEHVEVFFYHTGSLDFCNLSIKLLGNNASFSLRGAIFLKSDDSLNLKTNTLHTVPNTFARITVKTVLLDKACFDFEGMISIEPLAFKSDSYLQQDNLLLSDNVVCNTSPQLEIQANDVKASHGATVGGVEPSHLYYLQSRGLNKKQAIKLISEGFLSSVYGDNSPLVLKSLGLENFVF